MLIKPKTTVCKLKVIYLGKLDCFQLTRSASANFKFQSSAKVKIDQVNPFVPKFLVFGIFASDFEFDILIEHYRRLDENFFCISLFIFYFTSVLLKGRWELACCFWYYPLYYKQRYK